MPLRIGYSTQIFPIVDYITRQQIGTKPRSVVHRSGLWHEGVQAFIIRKAGRNKVQTLVQRRSTLTDISSAKLDQSLATQALIEDNGDLERTLKRGLLEELNIYGDEARYIRIGREGWLRVSKKYKEDPSLFNREFISLFIVQLVDESRVVTSASPKIQDVYWQDWGEFVESVQARPGDYTKTARFYILNQPILSSIQNAIRPFLEEKSPPPFPFTRSSFYSYAEGPDVFINKYYEDATVEIMEVERQANRKFFQRVISYDVYDAKDRPSVTFRFTLDNWENSIWREGVIHPSPRRASLSSKTAMEAIFANACQEIEQMENMAKDSSGKDIVDALFLKTTSNLSRIRSRVYAGDFNLLSEENAASQKLVLLAMPGTFDPPHLSHIDLMLEAFAHVSEARREIPTTYAGFLAPLGQNAPGPDGQTAWKPGRLPAALRHDLSKALTDIFSPLIQTSELSLEHPDEYGAQSALRLIDLYRNSFASIDFHAVAGSETFSRWHRNFAELLERHQPSFGPNVNLRIITFEDPLYPVERIVTEQGYKNVTIIRGFRNLGIHSRLFRETEDLSLLTQGVRDKYSQLVSVT